MQKSWEPSSNYQKDPSAIKTPWRMIHLGRLLLWRWHVCRVNFARKIFFRATNFHTKNAPKFSPKFLSLCSVCQKKSLENSLQISHKCFQISLRKIKKKFTDELLQERREKLLGRPWACPRDKLGFVLGTDPDFILILWSGSPFSPGTRGVEERQNKCMCYKRARPSSLPPWAPKSHEYLAINLLRQAPLSKRLTNFQFVSITYSIPFQVRTRILHVVKVRAAILGVVLGCDFLRWLF